MKEKTNPSHAKEFNNAIIFFDKYSSADLSEVKELCQENGLTISSIIYNSGEDIKLHKRLIQQIIHYDQPPIILLDSNILLFPQFILSLSIFAALEEMQLAKIYLYSKENESKKLTIEDAMFDLLTEAYVQSKAIAKICAEEMKFNITSVLPKEKGDVED